MWEPYRDTDGWVLRPRKVEEAPVARADVVLVVEGCLSAIGSISILHKSDKKCGCPVGEMEIVREGPTWVSETLE